MNVSLMQPLWHRILFGIKGLTVYDVDTVTDCYRFAGKPYNLNDHGVSALKCNGHLPLANRSQSSQDQRTSGQMILGDLIAPGQKIVSRQDVLRRERQIRVPSGQIRNYHFRREPVYGAQCDQRQHDDGKSGSKVFESPEDAVLDDDPGVQTYSQPDQAEAYPRSVQEQAESQRHQPTDEKPADFTESPLNEVSETRYD
jgi:hypothetical protein